MLMMRSEASLAWDERLNSLVGKDLCMMLRNERLSIEQVKDIDCSSLRRLDSVSDV